jgi:hypothetical protein
MVYLSFSIDTGCDMIILRGCSQILLEITMGGRGYAAEFADFVGEEGNQWFGEA